MLSWVDHEIGFILLRPDLDVDRLEKNFTVHRRLIRGSAYSNKTLVSAAGNFAFLKLKSQLL